MGTTSGGDNGVGDDDGGNVRIFNGNDGEWPARVRHASSTGGDGGGRGVEREKK